MKRNFPYRPKTYPKIRIPIYFETRFIYPLLIQSPAADSIFTPGGEEIDDVFFNSPLPTSPFVQMRQHPLARFVASGGPGGAGAGAYAAPGTPGVGEDALPAIQGIYLWAME